MNIGQSVLVALDNLLINRMRSFLTMIGIVFGVGAVVTIVSIGQAGQASLISSISNYKDGYFVVYPNPSEAMSAETSIRLKDIDEIRKIDGVRYASVSAGYLMNSSIKEKNIEVTVTGVTSEMNKMQNIKFAAGSFFTNKEEKTRDKVVVIDDAFAKKKYGGAMQALNKKIILSTVTFRIIGVYETEKNILSGLQGEQFFAYMPITTLLWSGYGIEESFYSLEGVAEDPSQIETVMNNVRTWLAKKNNVAESIYMSETGKDSEKSIASIFSVLQLIIGSIAVISLLVGGIGVMNIMLVSVTERTREIGIRKAIGATPKVIMQQFLVEAMVLSILGGTVGTLFGLLIAFIFSLISGWPFLISMIAIGLAFTFSSIVGIVSGLYPAYKAAKLPPIEALRYE